MKNNNKGCIHCINLKTVVVTPDNLIKFLFASTIRVKKRLKKDGQVRIYYCKPGVFENIYIETQANTFITYLKRKNCPYYNIVPKEDPAVLYMRDRLIYKK